MASANVELAADLNNFTTGQLLDRIEGDLQASDAIAGGNSGGLIDSLDRRRDGTITDSIGPYTSGTDRMSNLAVNPTFITGQAMAYKQRSAVQPRNLNVLVDIGDRYHGAMGMSLFSLTRLAVAAAFITAEHSQANVRAVVVSSGHEPLVIGEDDTSPEAAYLMSRYDKHVSELIGSTNGKKQADEKSEKSSALAEGLSLLNDDDRLQEDADVGLVVSDFVTGAVFDQDGTLVNFDWEQPLQDLVYKLDNRLYIARLTTPTQTELPFGYDFSSEGSQVSLDMATYMEFAGQASKLGTAKAERIAHDLSLLRKTELDSLDKAPFVTITDFMFGKPISEN